MKKKLLLLFLIGFSAHVFPQDYLEWDAKRKLTFSDFKAPVPKNNIENVRLSTKISFQTKKVNGKVVDFKIFNQLDRNDSWIKTKQQEIIDIQQIHFNLSELYARKIRKDVQILLENKEENKEKYVEIVKKHTQNLNKLTQSKSILIEDQPHLINIWEKEISDSLNLYNNFKN